MTTEVSFDDYVVEKFFGPDAKLKSSGDKNYRHSFADLTKTEITSFVERVYDDKNSEKCREGVQFWDNVLTDKNGKPTGVADMFTNFIRVMFRDSFERKYGRPPAEVEGC